MKSAIIVFPGSNRENDMQQALTRMTGRKPAMVWHTESTLPDGLDLVVLPGGFSFGDYLRPGAIAARSPILADFVKKAKQGVHVLGVCNGFQVLTEIGLLPGALMRNASLKFVCRDVHLKAENTTSVFTRGFSGAPVIRCPIAHHDGNYYCDTETLKRLQGENRIAFRYCDARGQVLPAVNPNGSLDNIAGILNERGTVLGMMPHPENLVALYQGGTDGARLFQSLIGTNAA